MVNSILLSLEILIIAMTAVLNIVYLAITIQVYKEQKIRVGTFFVMLFSLRIAITVIQAIRIIISPEQELLSDTVALGGILVGFTLIIIIESYWNVNFSALRISLASAFATLTTVFIILTRNEVIGQAIQSQFSLFVQLTVPLFFFYVAGTSNHLLKKMERYANIRQKKSISILRKIILIDYIGAPLLIMIGLVMFTTPQDPLPELNDFTFIWFSIIPSIIYLLVDVLWYYSIIKYRSFSILQIRRIDKIILMNPTGLAFYQYSPSKDTHMDEALISGAIYAIQSVLREGTKIVGSLRLIQMGEYYLLFNHGEGVTTIVITTQPTKYLESLSRLITQSVSSVVEPDDIDIDVSVIESIVNNVIEVAGMTGQKTVESEVPA